MAATADSAARYEVAGFMGEGTLCVSELSSPKSPFTVRV